jgi:hypothetical protein
MALISKNLACLNIAFIMFKTLFGKQYKFSVGFFFLRGYPVLTNQEIS